MPTTPTASGPHGIVAHSADVNIVGRDNIDYSVTNITNNVHPMPSAIPLDLRPHLLELEKHISRGAAHDSAERGPDAPKCHPETRAAVQEEIMSWIGYGDQDPRPTTILWLSGPAGSGKTAIAGSIADACHAKGWLSGSFFFSAFAAAHNRRSKRYLVSTLAYHLLQQGAIPGLKRLILLAIESTPSVFDKRLSEQLEILIIRPLRSLPPDVDRSAWPKAFVIDGLDECEGRSSKVNATQQDHRRAQEEDHREIISTLVRASRDPVFPFRIVIVSRPEPAIRDAISTCFDEVLRLFLDEKYSPDTDIACFLNAKFSDTRRRFNIPKSWPPQQDIQVLVECASGQFVYAVTVIRFIQDGTKPPPEQLRRLLEWRSLGEYEAFSPLDALYLGIIRTSPNPTLAARWLLSIYKIPATARVNRLCTEGWFVRGLLESSPGETDYLLGNLTSLVNLDPDQHQGLSQLFNFYHKSLGDFLDDHRRSGALYADIRVPASKRYTLTERIAQDFIVERVYAVVKNRGPQGTFAALHRPDGTDGVTIFLERLCFLLSDTISPTHGYNTGDVDWWWSCLDHANLTSGNFAQTHMFEVDSMFARIHKDCHWYKCLDSCKIWRKGILRHCTESGAWKLRKKAIKGRLYPLRTRGYEESFLGYSSHLVYLSPLRGQP